MDYDQQRNSIVSNIPTGTRMKGYNRVVVKDGDTIAVFATPPLSASDPASEFPVVAQVFRVVADWVNPTLVLVPLTATPVRIRQSEAIKENVIVR